LSIEVRKKDNLSTSTNHVFNLCCSTI